MTTTHDKHSKILIIGSGPAGYTAAIYAARACLAPTLVCGIPKGGQLVSTTTIENYPGFVDAISGQDLMLNMEQQARQLNVKIVEESVIDVDFNKRPFELSLNLNVSYTADTVIIATGAVAKWLGLESEEKFKGYGVSSCAVCDGFFYRQKDVLVIGGGNTAVEDAIYLTNHAKKVTLIHRRNELKAEKMLQQNLFRNPKIDIIWNTELDEVLGTDQPLNVNGAILRNVETGKRSYIKVDGVFVAIGHSPATELFVNKLQLDEEGYIITAPDSTQTSISGVFAAGDVKDKKFRQAVTAAGSGCIAALEAERYLASSTL